MNFMYNVHGGFIPIKIRRVFVTLTRDTRVSVSVIANMRKGYVK